MQSGLLHLSLRFRRFLGLALAAHVLVTAVITALAACNPVVDAVASGDAVAVAGATSHAHSTAQRPQPTAHSASHAIVASEPAIDHGSAHGSINSGPDAPSDAPPSHHHGSTTVTCPMSMACAVSALASHVPVLTTNDTYASSRRVLVNDSLPRSPRVAPEPPPPRA